MSLEKQVKDLNISYDDSANGNILARYSDKLKDSTKSVRVDKDKSDRATIENAIDPKTLKQMNKFITNGLLTKIDGCLSTGKEANIYYGINEETDKQYAIKVYKTSVLVFKDRERYINGEFRFKSFKNSNKINPRKLIRVWSEKEFRNLKRLKLHGFNVPEPAELRSNILLMEFLSSDRKGWPAPKLKDYEFANLEEVQSVYEEVLVNMRLMYQKCKLIHADLSEYNLIIHQGKVYIIDVSQSIEPTHPMAFDFLRMDIKNINDYFEKKRKLDVYMEKDIFKFISEDLEQVRQLYGPSIEDVEADLMLVTKQLKVKQTEEDEKEDEIFRSLYLMRDLNSLEEEDFAKFKEGKIDVFRTMVVDGIAELDSDDSDSGSEESESEEEYYEKEDKPMKGKRYEDKDDKKLRKQQVKEEKQEKRKVKMKKHVKQRMIKKTSKK